MAERKQVDLKSRTTEFALRIINLAASLPKGFVAEVLGKQVLRSGTSIGANYREARRASTQRQFASTLQIALREAEETIYWLELIVQSGLMKAERLQPLVCECDELIAILVTSVRTAKRKRDNQN